MKDEHQIKDLILKLRWLREEKATDDLLKVVYQRQISILEWVLID